LIFLYANRVAEIASHVRATLPFWKKPSWQIEELLAALLAHIPENKIPGRFAGTHAVLGTS